TILVPLYREAVVIPQLTRAIAALDWPKSKLDVRLLLEEDDLETIQAARAARLPAYFTFVIVPKDGPRGKPKACNYGLAHARGEYVVIYDAEDIPQPDQLRKAYVAFRSAGPALGCVQSRLNFYNPEQNLLTRWFTAEYSMWFDLLLPGLQRTSAPIPLGGTSNHFRRAVLAELGAWDPHNVTEDADLGVRLFKRGFRTAVIDSTTFEEANPRLGNWIRQRSRWIKGYAQTWLVHMRHPIRLWRALGPGGFLSFQFLIGGTVLVLLLNPLFWALTLLWFVSFWSLIERLFPGPIYYIAVIALYFGNFAFIALSVAGALARGHYRLVKYSLLSPFYWVLMSIAAWKGVLQLLYRPHYWEKTQHGLAPTHGTDPAAATPRRRQRARAGRPWHVLAILGPLALVGAALAIFAGGGLALDGESAPPATRAVGNVPTVVAIAERADLVSEARPGGRVSAPLPAAVAASPVAVPSPSGAPSAAVGSTAPAMASDGIPIPVLLQRVAHAVGGPGAGQIQATIAYGNGPHSLVEVRFDRRQGDETRRVELTTTYQAVTGAQQREFLLIGERAWQRRPQGEWVTLSTQDSVLEQVRTLLPQVASAISPTLANEGHGATLRWYDAERDADITLLFDPATGVPQQMRQVVRRSGLEILVTYRGWTDPMPNP
ncbi:MAG TPA: glycosyltransferase family 2 protein, partial [Thermomicrobiales bacterium]